MAKSYYAILGVSSDAAPDEIRSAYRLLAKEFHPDHYAGDSRFFREIQEAWSVLGDPQKRGRYDEKIKKIPLKKYSGPRSPYPAPEPLIPENKAGVPCRITPLQTLMPTPDEIFDRLWGSFSGMEQRESGRNMYMEVKLTDEQFRYGGNLRIMVPAQADCPVCRGYGGIGYYECMRCTGEGRISGEVPLSLVFPPGIRDGHTISLSLHRFGIPDHQLTVRFRHVG